MNGDDIEPPRGAYSRRIRATLPEGIRVGPENTERPLNAAELGRRQRRRMETFEQLVAVAREVLFDKNLKDTSVEQITNSADVGKGTFFNYFQTKEHVVPKTTLFDNRLMLDAVARVASGEASVPQVMVERFKNYVCPEKGTWLTYEQNLIQSLLHDDLRREFSEQVTHQQDYHVQMMRVGQRQGSIRQDLPAEALAYVSQMFFNGLTVMFWINGQTPTQAMVERILGSFFSMLQPPPSTTAAPARRRKPVARKSRAASRGKRL